MPTIPANDVVSFALRPYAVESMPSFHLVLLDSTDASALPPGVQNALAQSAMVLTCHVGIDAEALDGARGDDLVACVTDANFAQLVKSMADLATAAPSSPLSLLSPPLDEAAHAALVEAGVHAWSSIDRVEKSSLEAMLAQARARCRREAALRLELVQMRTQMDDRKWVEKAKGLLMGEGEAFAMLRQTSMHANLRLGEVARSVVDAAQWAEAINRAGQLRMLSQRLARLAAQALTGVDVTRSRLLRRQTSDRVEENLAYLGALELPAAACVDLEHTKSAWRRLSAAWSARITREAMTAINAEAEALLASAEVLAASLEIASNRRALRVINLCGRQRMLTERIAKVTLLGEADSPGLVPLAEQFEQALHDLERAPLTSAEIRDLLVKAREEWLRLARGVQQMSRPQAGISLVRSAEALVTTFDQLAGEYEHSLQVILS